MKTMESNAARQYRLQQWAEQIKDCNSRPAELSVKDWCNQNAITPANYYYRLREVRKACLANIPQNSVSQQLVPVPAELTVHNATEEKSVELVVNGVSIRVTDCTSPELLAMVLQVAANVK